MDIFSLHGARRKLLVPHAKNLQQEDNLILLGGQQPLLLHHSAYVTAKHQLEVVYSAVHQNLNHEKVSDTHLQISERTCVEESDYLQHAFMTDISSLHKDHLQRQEKFTTNFTKQGGPVALVPPAVFLDVHTLLAQAPSAEQSPTDQADIDVLRQELGRRYSIFRGVVTTFISQLRLSFTRSAIAGIKS